MATYDSTEAMTPLSSHVPSQSPSIVTKITEDEQTAKKQKLNNMPIVIDITKDPVGDMLVKIGKDEAARLVRVHSLFLKLGSHVFHAMLSTRYAECGRTFMGNDPLTLEEDDPDAFNKLCKVLHYQVRNQTDPEVEDLPKLAIIADKYGATTAIKSTFTSMLGPLFGPNVQGDLGSFERLPVEHLGNIICISYIIDDAQLFWRATRFAVASNNGFDRLHKARPELVNLVRDSTFGMATLLSHAICH